VLVEAPLAVDTVEMLGARVVRLKVVVGDRPRGRDPTEVTDFAEIEQIIRDKESLDEAKKAAVSKPTNPASNRTAKPAAAAKPSTKESTSPLKPIKPNVNPLAPRPKQRMDFS
jgi:hypothetical protein